MAAEVTAPALAQALEMLTQQVDYWRGHAVTCRAVNDGEGAAYAEGNAAAFIFAKGLIVNAAARLRSAETRPDIADVLRVWNSWRQGMHLGGFTHSDGVRFVEALTALYANTAAPALPGETPAAKACCAPAPDRSGRSCDKPQGHNGDHWTYGGNEKTWPGETPAEPPLAERVQAALTDDVLRHALSSGFFNPDNYDLARMRAVLLATLALPPPATPGVE